MENEIWKPIAGYEGAYSVSNLGRVKGEPRLCSAGQGRIRFVKSVIVKSFPCESNHGYLQVRLSLDGKGKTFLVHLLVLNAFVGPPGEDQECAHENGVRSDAKLSNLSWKTLVKNQADKIAHGTRVIGEVSVLAKFTDEQARAIKMDPRTSTAIAKEFGVHPSTISRMKVGKRWSHL